MASVISSRVPHARFLVAARRGNVRGALDMGLAPGMLPGRALSASPPPELAAAWGELPGERGHDATGILTAAASGEIDVLFLLGADPLTDFPRQHAGAPRRVGCGHGRGGGLVREPVGGGGRHRAACARVRGEVGHHDQPGGTRLGRRRIGDGAGFSPPRLDDRGRAGRAVGRDLGFLSVGEITAEIAAVCTTHAAATGPALAADGVVASGAAFRARVPARTRGTGARRLRPPLGLQPQAVRRRA